TYLADNEQTLTDALSRMPRDFSPNVYNHYGSYSDLLTLFDGRGSFVSGYTDHFTATLESLLAPSVSPDFLTSYPTQLVDYLEAVNTAISAGDNAVFSGLLQQGQTLLTGMEALTDALLAMPEQLLTPEEAAQRFNERHPDYEANLAALSEAKATYAAALDAEQNIKAEIEALKDSVNLSKVNTTYLLNHYVNHSAEFTPMRAIFPYFAMKYTANFHGYNNYFRDKYFEQLDLVTDSSSHHENQLRLQDYLVQTEWTTEDIAESEALTRYWVNEIEHIEAVLESLPDNFLTLEEATALRETNPGNTYTGTLTTYVAPSDVYTTEQALEATLLQVEKDANWKLGVVRNALSAMRSLNDAFERLDASKDMMLAAQAEVDRLDALIPDVTVEQAYEKTVATTVNWSKTYLSKLLSPERVDAEFALIDIKLAHTRAQHVYDNALAEKERTTLAVHAYAEPSVITEHLPHLTHYITLKNDHYGSTVWKATKTPQQAESALIFLSNVKSQLDELYAQASEEQTKGELQAALALVDEMVVAIEADQRARIALDSATAALADAPALPTLSDAMSTRIIASADEMSAQKTISKSLFNYDIVPRVLNATSLHITNTEVSRAIRAVFSYNSSQFGAYVNGYSNYFDGKFTEQLGERTSRAELKEGAERLKMLSVMASWQDEDIAETLALTTTLLTDLQYIKSALELLPANFLTLGKAEDLRASNLGNVALDDIAVSVASSEDITTEQALEAVLAQVHLDVAEILEDVEAAEIELLRLQLNFQVLANARSERSAADAFHAAAVMRRAQDGSAETAVVLADVRYEQAVEEKAQTKAVVRGYTSFYRVTEYLPQHDYTLHHSGYNNPIFHATESDSSALRANSFLTGIQNELRALRNDTEDEAKQLGITEAMSLVDEVMAAIIEDRAARSWESVAQTELAHAKALASDVAEYLEASPEMPAFGVLSGLLSHLVSHQGAIADVVSDRGASALATDLGDENGLLWQAS
ncbi:hypothetical protein, partial [Enterovibrio baiacu]|uniref:hypothetical protein n=1 Tax=Enterovibrio baiacu TaxID=2491023 RepID=UPI001386864F